MCGGSVKARHHHWLMWYKASNEVDQLGIFPMTTAANHPFEVSVSVNGKPINFTVDTGQSVS